MSRRRSSKELKELLIGAGLSVLYRRGLRANASHVPMTDATQELERSHGITVGMGSIFGENRLWENVGQFQIDLLVEAIRDRSGGGPNDRSIELLTSLPDHSHEPLADRMALLVELCRVAGLVNGYVRTDESKGRSWDLWVAIWSTAMADQKAADQLLPHLRDEEERTISNFTALYSTTLEKLGLRVRAPYTIQQMATLGAAITDGVALRSAIAVDGSDAVSSPRGSDDWNNLGVGIAAIALEFVENATGEAGDELCAHCGQPRATNEARTEP